MAMKKYTNPAEIKFYSKRYGKYITVPKGYHSDGATGAIDIWSEAWWVHDKLCDTGKFDDGALCTNFMASSILCEVLRKEGRWIRSIFWWLPTFLFGGGKCRERMW